MSTSQMHLNIMSFSSAKTPTLYNATYKQLLV